MNKTLRRSHGTAGPRGALAGTSPELVPGLGFRTNEGGGDQLNVLDGSIVAIRVTPEIAVDMVAPAGHFTEHGVDAVSHVGVLSLGMRKNWLPPVGALVLAMEMVHGSWVGRCRLRRGSCSGLVDSRPRKHRCRRCSSRTIWRGRPGRCRGEIAALNHKVVNDPVEDGAVVVPVLDEEFEVLNVNRTKSGYNSVVTVPLLAPPFHFN